jgi:hypothetical protein
MAEMLRRATDRPHLVSLDIGRPVVAKAAVHSVDMDWLRAVGQSIARAVAIVGWSHKEAAASVGVDAAEFGKWLSGERRPHLDRLLAVDALRRPLVVSLAGLDESARISTTIEFDARRPA